MSAPVRKQDVTMPRQITARNQSPSHENNQIKRTATMTQTNQTHDPSLIPTSTKRDTNYNFVGFQYLLHTEVVMSHEPMLFCGPSYDPGTGTWSTYHLLEDGLNIIFKDLRAIITSKDTLIIKEVCCCTP